MTFYVGLDVSNAETAVCVVDQNGEIVDEASVATEPGAIATYLQQGRRKISKIGMEAGNLSIWLYWALRELEFPVLCIDTRHTHAFIGLQAVKTDKNDARVIANIMRVNVYREVHVKSDTSQRIKMLVNSRRCLVDQRVVLENQVRGTLKIFGLKIGDVTPKQYEMRVRKLINGDGELEAGVLPILKVRKLIQAEVAILDSMLRQVARNDPACQILMTMPCVGLLTAVLFRVVIDEPRRFRKSKDVAAHLGLTPRKYASGDVNYNGRITKCGDAMLRNHLYEAASIMLRPTTKRNAIKQWGTKISKRSSLKNARIAVARKMAITLHRMWVDEAAFNWGDEGDIAPITAQ